jgi:hypothetical protein
MYRIPDIACDLWIIREWMTEKDWQGATENQRQSMIDARLYDEQAGYELPTDYHADARLHVFASDDCEVWLGCLSTAYISPEGACRVVLESFSDQEFAELVRAEGLYAVMLDDCRVIGEYYAEPKP